MTEKSAKPQLRFAGFDDTWEQRKLGELSSLITKGTTPLDKSNMGTVNFVKIESIDNSSGEITITQKITSEEHEGYLRRSQLKENDILFSIAGTLGRVTSVKSSILPANTNQALAIIRLKSGCLKYVKTYLKGKAVADFIKKNPTIGAQPNLSLEQVSNLEIALPSDIEQEQIGSFFENLDNLITLHQRKYDKLTNVKKSMLEKMFPKNGSNVPEIRFKGFSDAWEQRKLSDIADKVTEKNGGLQYIETFTNSAEYGIISQRDYFDHDIAKIGSLDGYYIVRNEDFVYNPRISTSAPVGPINRNKLGRTGVMSPLYTVFRPHDVDTTYLEHFFKSKYWHSFMNFNGDSGARSDRFSIKDSVFFEMPVPIPHIEEQRKIGECLTNIDNLITLHQRELEKLKNLKKACLEKMFV